jgi:hypothetical protein
MSDRSKLGGDEPRPAPPANTNGNAAPPPPPTTPMPRLMATGLPEWDLEPPAVLIRRGPGRT